MPAKCARVTPWGCWCLRFAATHRWPFVEGRSVAEDRDDAPFRCYGRGRCGNLYEHLSTLQPCLHPALEVEVCSRHKCDMRFQVQNAVLAKVSLYSPELQLCETGGGIRSCRSVATVVRPELPICPWKHLYFGSYPGQLDSSQILALSAHPLPTSA